MPLAVVGVSHHTAPVEVRERFAFGEEEGLEALLRLREGSGIEEAVLLSTCNRTEMYLYPALSPELYRHVETIFQQKSGPLPAPVREFLYRREGDAVPDHLFRVTSGLDSLVMGEAEIQGQVRSAYQRSAQAEAEPSLSGPVLHRLFQTALSVGGRVRDETAIGQGAASVASVAVDLARKIFGKLSGKRVLVLGAGETAGLVVEALNRQGVEGVVVANRTLDRAADLADRFRGRAVSLDQITRELADVDIVVASTAAPHAIVTRRTLGDAFPKGLQRALLLIDIAIPRDVAPEVGEEPSVFLYNVDDLRRIVDDTLARRRDAVADAERIIAEHAADFAGWYQALEVVPVIRRLRARGEEVRRDELERLLRTLGPLQDGQREAVEGFSRRLLNKLLHEPTVRLRDGAARGMAGQVLDAARLLYDLDAPGVAHPGADTEDGPRRAAEAAPAAEPSPADAAAEADAASAAAPHDDPRRGNA